MTVAIRIPPLAHHRMSAGLSQRALAKQVGVSYQVIRRIEQGQDTGNIHLRTLVLIATAVHVDLPALLTNLSHEAEPSVRTQRLSRDQVFLLRRIARDEPVSQQMSTVERTITLPSLIKSGLVAIVGGRPALTCATIHSLGSGNGQGPNRSSATNNDHLRADLPGLQQAS